MILDFEFTILDFYRNYSSNILHWTWFCPEWKSNYH